ncbi:MULTISPECIES: D-alanyl-D-alanine carboxypeptidase family protein [Desulfitobacterium]|uniref:serine-type D-Ala-D-Ala carboxypeptidase n=1 Tax=Desulfitobacterium dehalogenans (strain ATCC 51507 / DSM 9161 / JW/IU-DC1) TaxID=756499 RepID=I4AB49_DESDJ|nr:MULTISPECIES: D-alanyl-D-alanine carboxypeptidase family protein [Desulfitobacterium]AFM01184.1 D-alanyl-D-alanine carboxypeptidase [Desulfitobacterium dehalogenans ATCC 51507]
MRKALALIFALALLVGNLVVPHQAYGAVLETDAVSAILLDAKSGQILFEKEIHKELPPASVTKLMTLLVAAEAVESGRVSLTDKVTASEGASSLGGSQIYLEPGETFSLEEMLISIAVGSANDACYAVGEHISGTHEAFVEEMNKKAKAIGANHTHFVNAYGLPAEGHYTSAYDLALMGREALKYPLIRKLTSMKEYDLRGGKFKLWNTNKLLWWYEGADGFKTGWTSEANYCLASTVERDGLRLIAVVMGVPQVRGHFTESMKLYNYGFANFAYKEYAPAGQKQGVIKVHKGMEEDLVAVTEKALGVTVQKGNDKNIWAETKLNPDVEAPIKAGQKVGEILLYRDNEMLTSVNLVAEKDIEKAGIGKQIIRTLEGVFGF